MCLGIPGKIIETYQANNLPMGKIDFGGIVREVCLVYLDDIEIGDYAIVHVGFAISKLDEKEALETLELLKEIDAITQELEPDTGEA